MNRNLLALSLSLAATLSFGCAPAGNDTAGNDTGVESEAITLPVTDTSRVLDFVNYPGNDVDVLNVLVGLETRAATAVVSTRNGRDGTPVTADDVYFLSLAQLDAVPFIGDASIKKISAYAAAHPAPTGVSVKGVSFHGWQAEAIIWGVNQEPLSGLDALLDSRAAQGLVAHRPFTSIAQMGNVPYVAASALNKLHGESQSWWNAMVGASNLAGIFDGVTFDEATATVALAIANTATLAELTQNKITSTAAGKIIAARPYASLAAVSAVSGVGIATMNDLHLYATSGTFTAPSSCVGSFQSTVGPHLADLLFLSESDRPFNIVSFPGAGTTAPTAASVLALVGGTPGSTTETRDPNNYYGDFETSGGDPNAAALVEAAIAAQLTDVVYIAVIPPDGSINQSLVDVYLVGRTACGDLVGLHAISVET